MEYFAFVHLEFDGLEAYIVLIKKVVQAQKVINFLAATFDCIFYPLYVSGHDHSFS